MTVSVPGYAKINLFLDIRSIRDDGYHNILSIMQRIDLHDTVTVSYSTNKKKSISLTCDKPEIPCDAKNLAYKAADLFPICGNIEIHIEKRIPMSAGLAGGSADAAATLIALNSLCDKPLSTEELCDLGAKLGADVPFCIKGGACLVEGIGEIMTPVSSMPEFPIVVAKKGEGMSTPAAYRALDVKFNKFENYRPWEDKCNIILNSDQNNDIGSFCSGLFNIFETVVEPERVCVTELKSTMIKNGAIASMMSGSGTSVFGIFSNVDDALKVEKLLRDRGAEAYVCYPI